MIYAMSDIHGCLRELKDKMTQVDLQGDNRLIFYLVARFQQTLNAPLRRVLVNAVARRRDEMNLRHGNSLLNEKLIVYIMPRIRRLLQGAAHRDDRL